MGVIVFSPGGKVFSFGNPDVRSVIDGFRNHTRNPFLFAENGPNATVEGLNNVLTQETAKLEAKKEKKKYLEQIRSQRTGSEKWWELPPSQLNLSQTTRLINALEKIKMDLESQRPQPVQATAPQNYHDGSFNNNVQGGNIDTFDQRSMIDMNAFNYNPNMVIPNHGPVLGFNNNSNVIDQVSDPRNNMTWPEYNHNPY
ncbi:unnamed protein product [Microthlaspi erraticum]|uniref:MADS-box domain-containing protein n=1 Tax=Microthlaspi erraticum TaxID=1685480 RepID=A0A6D2I4H5_9BRAS|nr:unnamed protein product [Microthlaspi erraticum]